MVQIHRHNHRPADSCCRCFRVEKMAGQQGASSHRDSGGSSRNDEPDIIEKIWDDSKAHFIVFGGLTVSLFIVKCRNAVKLEESGGKIKK